MEEGRTDEFSGCWKLLSYEEQIDKINQEIISAKSMQGTKEDVQHDHFLFCQWLIYLTKTGVHNEERIKELQKLEMKMKTSI